MSSELLSALAELQLNDYTSLVLVTAVIYDYCLVIPKEVTYIWNRPWTWVSTLFLPIRYMGCLFAITAAFGGSTFIPGQVKPANTSHDIRRYIIDVLTSWSDAIFWASADLVMILRVHAMYNQSKTMLRLLLVLYATEVITFVIFVISFSSPNHITVIAQLPDITVCTYMIRTQTLDIVAVIAQCTLGTVVCVLVVAKFVRDSLEMYQVTRTWQTNRYIGLLTRDGFFYFLATLFNVLINMLGILGVFPSEAWVAQLVVISANIAAYTLVPRFVINVRELYALYSQGLCNRDIDTGFGLSSGARHGVGGTTTIGTIGFAQGGAPEGLEDMVEMATVERVEGTSKQILEV